MPLYNSITEKLNVAKYKLEGAYCSLIVIIHERQRERERIAMEAAVKAAEEAAEKERQQQQQQKQQQSKQNQILKNPVMDTGLVLKTASHLEDRDDDEYDDAYLSTAELAEGKCRVADEDWILVQKPLGR